MDERDSVSPGEALESKSRRNIALSLLGVIGGASLLQGCDRDQLSAESPTRAELGLATEALTGSRSWFDTVTGVSSPSLKTTAGDPGGQTVLVGGYAAVGDGGGGVFTWTADITSSDDSGTLIVPSGTRTGTWKRVFSGLVDVRWFGVIPSTASNDTSFSAALAYAKSHKSALLFPAGTYNFASPWDLTGSAGVSFVGETSALPSSGGSTVITFTMSSGTAIKAPSAYGITFRNLDLQANATNGTFNGTLISFDPGPSSSSVGGYHTIQDCALTTVGGMGTLLGTNRTFNCSVINCRWGACKTAVLGPVDTQSDFANAWAFINCVTPDGNCQGDVFLNPGQAWSWTGCSFGTLVSVSGRAIRTAAGTNHLAIGNSINACWFGDSTGGAWVEGNFLGLSATGNQFTGNASATTAFRFTAATIGFSSRGNSFANLAQAYDFGTLACTNVDCRGNVYTSITSGIYTGTPISGHVDNTASVAIFDGAEEKRFSRLKARISTSGQTIPSNVITQLASYSVDFDPNLNMGGGTGAYTCHQSGFYQVNAFIELVMGAGYVEPFLYVNGVLRGRGPRGAIAAGGGTAGAAVNDIVVLAFGDTLDMRVYQSSGTTATVYSGNLSIHYLSS